MKSFWRSLKYLRPYRLRLALTLLCVVVIALLWAGGLGMLLPGAKVLLSPEGLHGWAYQEVLRSSFGCTFAIPEGGSSQAAGAAGVEVLTVNPSSPAEKAGLRKGQVVEAAILAGGMAEHQHSPASAPALPAMQLLSQLAHLPAGHIAVLRVRQPVGQEQTATPRLSAVEIVPREAQLGGKALLMAADQFEIPSSYPDRFVMLVWLVAIGAGITIIRNLVRFCQDYLVTSIILREIVDIRNDNYNTVLRLPMSYFWTKGTSDPTSRFIQDTSEVAGGHGALLGATLIEPAKALAALVVAMVLNWKLTLLAVLAGPPGAYLVRHMGKKMHQASRRALQSWSAMLAILQETLGGIRAVKTYTMEACERKRFLRANRQLLKHQTRIAMIDAGVSPIVETVGIMAAMAAVAWAGYYVLHNQQGIDREKFLALIACLGMILGPVRRIGNVSTRLHRSDAAAKRVFELMDSPQEKTSATWPHLARHRELIEFRDVSFRYPAAQQDALSNFSLRIPAGNTVAFVGPNGSGKTTLISLVPRLLEPTAGCVLVDGQDIGRHSLRSLRRQIALVSQDTVIFNATIAENISYGLRRCGRELIEQASRKAFVHEFVEQMPQGYDTLVGQRGSTLSGGQCQRIAIARAILRDPSILIFDEAMSQVDSQSEQRIRQAMSQFVKGRTTLVVAHRLSTVLDADLIVVMDCGKIVDTGSHSELINRCPLYQRLHQTQLQ